MSKPLAIESDLPLPSWLRPAVDTSWEEHLRERAIYLDWLDCMYFRQYIFDSFSTEYFSERFPVLESIRKEWS